MLNFIKNIIAPKRCYSCNKEWHFLCLECLSKMSNFDSICYICKGKSNNFSVHKKCKNNIYFDNLIILTHYKNFFIKKSIKDAKFYNKKDIFEDYWNYLWAKILENLNDKNLWNYKLLPVPMNFFRKIFRWYNQSEVLAKYISKNTWIWLENKLIKRARNTRQQSKLNKNDRWKNLEKAFIINKKLLDKLDNKNFIIVDDVVSTWTTINEISKILKNSWAKKIIGLAIASD